MTRKFLELFSINDPGWGNSHSGSGSKDAKDGQSNAGDQAPQVEPSPNADQPTEAQPRNPQPGQKPAKPDGPPDLDELWRDFNDRLSGLFGGKKNPNLVRVSLPINLAALIFPRHLSAVMVAAMVVAVAVA